MVDVKVYNLKTTGVPHGDLVDKADYDALQQRGEQLIQAVLSEGIARGQAEARVQFLEEENAGLKQDRQMIRKEVNWFAEQMEAALNANDHKGGWYDCNEGWLLRRISHELGELRRARKKGHEAVMKECADIANFAMMIADNREKQWGDEQRDAEGTKESPVLLQQREAKKASYKFSLEERLGQEYRRAEGLQEGVERLYQTLQNHPPPAHENGIEYCQAWQSFQTEICGQLRAFLDALPDCRYVCR